MGPLLAARIDPLDLALCPAPPPGSLPVGPSIKEVQRSGRDPGDPKAIRETEAHTQVRVRDVQGTRVSAGGHCEEPKYPMGKGGYVGDPGAGVGGGSIGVQGGSMGNTSFWGVEDCRGLRCPWGVL